MQYLLLRLRSRLVAAYEDCLCILNLADRSDPVTGLLAKKIIEIGQTGMRDPVQIGQLALKELRIPNPE